ncbi:hypothetical protein [Notoacmeibacter marinus]|uniref:hypothetical protein n=1 Tax=Notoacmeibacter marinus TaxID=1876515 RepID=UPI0013B057E2|nr:hypothetical protein [Notoacmeibacter marinus]
MPWHDGGASFAPAISVASGMLVLRKGDEVVGVIEQATGRAVSLSDNVLANHGAKATNRGAGGFYDPQEWRQNYDDFYNSNVTSTTVPPYSAKNVQLAGQRHPETGVVFDQRGFPVFDNHSAYDTRFTGAVFQNAS